MEMQSQIVNVLGLVGIFILILLMGEFIHREIPTNPEISRKVIHFLSGLTALSFPYLIRSHWLVLMLAVSFSFIIMLAKKKGFLKSIRDVKRRSYGELYFPMVVYVIFLLGHNRPILYFISILVMTVSDTLAALVGGKYGSVKYEVEGNIKSLEGSIVFFFVTFLCVHLSLLLMTPIDRLISVLIALVIAILVTGFEAISVIGIDNIFVPFGTYYILSKMTNQTLAVTIEDLWRLLLMIAVTVPISMKSKLLKSSGLIGMVLVNYAAWSLCDFYWFLPLLLAQIMLYLLAMYFVQKVAEEIIGYQIKVLVYSAIIPTALIFTSNTIDNYDILYLPYLTAIVGQIAIIFYFFLSVTRGKESKTITRLRSNKFIMAVVCSIASTLFIAAAPLLLYRDKARLNSLGIIGIGVLISIFVFHFLSMRHHLEEKRLLRQKMRLLSVVISVVVVAIMQMLLIM